MKLKRGLYILLYHDVSWQENNFVRCIGGSCAPDVFKAHVEICKNLGILVSTRDGLNLLRRDELNAPTFCFWFDDGFAGVRKYAAPVLSQLGISAASSICSRFVLRTEMFWRFKLSILESVGATQLLADALRVGGHYSGGFVRERTMENFNLDCLTVIDEMYKKLIDPAVAKSGFEIFENEDGLRDLHSSGWMLANHTAGHYPVCQANGTNLLLDEFEECERFLTRFNAKEDNCFVVPFDSDTDDAAVQRLRTKWPNADVVFVRNRIAQYANYHQGHTIFRIEAPNHSSQDLISVLKRASRGVGPRWLNQACRGLKKFR